MVKKEKNDSTMKESTEESRSQMFDYSELINSRLHQMKSYECWDISTQKYFFELLTLLFSGEFNP